MSYSALFTSGLLDAHNAQHRRQLYERQPSRRSSLPVSLSSSNPENYFPQLRSFLSLDVAESIRTGSSVYGSSSYRRAAHRSSSPPQSAAASSSFMVSSTRSYLPFSSLAPPVPRSPLRRSIPSPKPAPSSTLPPPPTPPSTPLPTTAEVPEHAEPTATSPPVASAAITSPTTTEHRQQQQRPQQQRSGRTSSRSSRRQRTTSAPLLSHQPSIASSNHKRTQRAGALRALEGKDRKPVRRPLPSSSFFRIDDDEDDEVFEKLSVFDHRSSKFYSRERAVSEDVQRLVDFANADTEDDDEHSMLELDSPAPAKEYFVTGKIPIALPPLDTTTAFFPSTLDVKSADTGTGLALKLETWLDLLDESDAATSLFTNYQASYTSSFGQRPSFSFRPAPTVRLPPQVA